jgi:hypothetical protein
LKEAVLGAATSLARLWRDDGKRTKARNLLAPIYDWFTEGFDAPVLQEAKACSTSWCDAKFGEMLSDPGEGPTPIRF